MMSAVDELIRELDRLEGQAQRLRDRLTPVLLAHPEPAGQAVTVPAATSALLVRLVVETSARIGCVADLLSGIHDRLAI